MPKIEVVGKTPINKYIYFSGKFSAYLSWMAILLQFFGPNIRMMQLPPIVLNASLITAIAAFILGLIAMTNLGSALRFGLPSEKTKFKSDGLYAVSRNPIYVAFNIISLSAIVYTSNIYVAILAIYGIYTHHLVTLSEEKFLAGRFGQKYQDYKKRVRRYL
jgi:protein-S-isoprenylcysteine O-methyltransferase Ste14